MQQKLVVLLGPTATGKSSLGIALAKLLDAEIISGDSVLLYKGFNIGSAKPTVDELAQVPHHLIDVLDGNAKFDVTMFKQAAEALIADINKRGKLPIIVGGTGLYIKALLQDYVFAEVKEDTMLRDELIRFATEFGNQALHDKLAALDTEAAARLHINDVNRVIRAIEVALNDPSHQVGAQEDVREDYHALVYGLNMQRDELYERINKRVDIMLASGLLDEVRSLIDSGISANAQAMQSIGYKQMVDYLNGLTDQDSCHAAIKQATRRFAKRQITWYKKMPYIKWQEITEQTDILQLATTLAGEIREELINEV